MKVLEEAEAAAAEAADPAVQQPVGLTGGEARLAGHCGCACWISPRCSPTNMDVPSSLAVEGSSLAQ